MAQNYSSPKHFVSKLNCCLSVRDNVWELWLFVRQFSIAAVLNLSHLKVAIFNFIHT